MFARNIGKRQTCLRLLGYKQAQKWELGDSEAVGRHQTLAVLGSHKDTFLSQFSPPYLVELTTDFCW